MSATFIYHAAVLAAAARDLSPQALGVTEVLAIAAQSDDDWDNWVHDVIDRHPDGEDGSSPLITAWLTMERMLDRRRVARAASRLLVPAPNRGRRVHQAIATPASAALPTKPEGQIISRLVAPKCVLLILRREDDNWLDFSMLRMSPRAFKKYESGTPLGRLAFHPLRQESTDDAAVGDEIVLCWKRSHLWCRTLAKGEEVVLRATLPQPQEQITLRRVRL